MSVSFSRLLAGSETLRASGSAGIMVTTRIIGALGTLAYTALMARMLTPQEFGMVWTLWSAVFIAAYLTTLNIGATAIREVVRARATGNDSSAAGFIIISRRVLFIASGPVIAGFVGLIWWRNPAIIHDYPIAVYLAAATIPVMGWNATNAAQAAALDQVLRSQLPGMLLRPIVFIAALGMIWLIGLSIGPEAVVAIYLIVVVLIALVQNALVRRYFGFMKSAVPNITGWKRWISTGLMLAPNRLLSDRLKDVLLLISVAPLGTVGVAQMAVALSIVNSLNFGIVAVETSFAPKTARSLTHDLAGGGTHTFRRATHFIAFSGILKMAMVIAGAITLWLLMPLIISLFGPDYAASESVIWWFLLIPLANVFFGNTSLVMQVFDQRTEFFMTSLLALIALPLVGIYGVPWVVANGVDPLMATAALFALTMVLLQAFRWFLCCWRTGIDVSFLGALIRRQRQIREPAL